MVRVAKVVRVVQVFQVVSGTRWSRWSRFSMWSRWSGLPKKCGAQFATKSARGIICLEPTPRQIKILIIIMIHRGRCDKS